MTGPEPLAHLLISGEGVVVASDGNTAGGVPAWVVVGSPGGFVIPGLPSRMSGPGDELGGAHGHEHVIEWRDLAIARLRRGGRDGDELSVEAPGSRATGLSVAISPDEGIFGLGERFDRVDQRGSVRRLWVENGAHGEKAYKPVPVVMSSAGWGVVALATRAVTVSAGSPIAPERLILLCDGESARIVVLHARGLAGLVERYTSLAGRAEVPPRWFFLPWKAGDWNRENQVTVVADLRKQSEIGVTWGAKLIDAGWEREGHDFTFDKAKYPDPAGILRLAEESQTAVVLWISPSITAGTEAHREAAAAGALITDETGAPYVHDLGNQPGWRGSAVDFTSERAVRWWQDKLRPLVEAGVRGFKTDFGEQLPADCVLADGRRGFEVHNDYPRLYNEATWAVVRPAGGVLLARSAWHGSQPLSAIWAGDQSSDYSPWAGLPSAIVAGQTAGLCGFPYWGSDIGGYFGSPTADCFARWTEFSAYCPLMQLHGLGVREPWELGEEVLSIFVRYARLHASLVEYSLHAAEQARRSGMPMMRAMALVDAAIRHPDWVEYQYCYGDELLVAPVYAATRERRVYLPPGRWWSEARRSWHEGPTVLDEDAPLDTIPVFVRAGAVIPREGDDGVELHLHPSPGVRRELRLADGARLLCVVGRQGELHVECCESTRPLSLHVELEAGQSLSLATTAGRHAGEDARLRFLTGRWQFTAEVRDAR